MNRPPIFSRPTTPPPHFPPGWKTRSPRRPNCPPAASCGGGPGAKALNKLLDTHYAADLKRFQRHKNDDELYAAWTECLRHG
jgi:hypothetical protein